MRSTASERKRNLRYSSFVSNESLPSTKNLCEAKPIDESVVQPSAKKFKTVRGSAKLFKTKTLRPQSECVLRNSRRVLHTIDLMEGVANSSESKEVPDRNPYARANLLDACKNGDLQAVRYLVETTKVDINQTGNIIMDDGTALISCTALHAAVIGSQTHIVACLTRIRRLNIDAITDRRLNNVESANDNGLTALHLAVLHLSGISQSKIVSCLLRHGADWTINNAAGKQCWELTSSVDLTILLLHHGVGTYSAGNSTSSNIAHKWARSSDDRSCEVISMAIADGVDMDKPDAKGLSPVMYAAIGQHGQLNLQVFEQLFYQNVRPVIKEHRINAMELAGATLILDGQLERGLNAWRKAMEFRFNVEDPHQPPIRKQRVTYEDIVRVAFRDAREVQTKQELESIMSNPTLLEEQAVLVYIRILGLRNDITLQYVKSYARGIADRMWREDRPRSLDCMKLIVKMCDSTESNLSYVTNFIIDSLCTISGLREDNVHHSLPSSATNFNTAMFFLNNMLNLLLNSDEENSAAVDFILELIVNYTYILLAQSLTSEQSIEFKYFLRKTVSLRKRNSSGYDLLLMACSPIFFAVYYNSDSEMQRRFLENIYHPNRVISLLLEVGADPNSKNNNGETAFQVFASKNRNHLASELLPANAPLDQIILGKTVAEMFPLLRIA